ncbi:hypothetical protein EBR56_09045, partial [bacterium]|nr:hypothetical protein [bacterium]
MASVRRSLDGFYTGEFASEFRARTKEDVDARPIAEALDDDGAVLQDLYIRRNPNPIGSKHLLDAADDDSAYTKAHATFHPLFRNMMQRYGLADVFLVDAATGSVVYSVVKEIDFAASLRHGPLAASTFAKAFQEAVGAGRRDAVAYGQFSRYMPSLMAPTSFIAAPVYDGRNVIGVIAFQIAIDRADAIINETTGMGTTGETYAIGPDRMFRSNSRFAKDLGVESTIINPTIKVDTLPVRSALDEGKAGTALTTDYRGAAVLSSWTPVTVHRGDAAGTGAVRWALVSEIDTAEVLGPINRLRTFAQGIFGLTALGVLGVSLAIARRDLLEFVRDRRTLVITLLLPMATYPILALSTALGLRTASQEIEARTAPARVRVGISGPDASRLAALIERVIADTPRGERTGWPADVAIADVRGADVAALLDEGGVDLSIDARRGLVRDLEASGTVRLPVLVSAKRPASPVVREQFETFVNAVGRHVARDRVRAAGLPATLLEPVRVAFEGDRGAAAPPAHNVLSTLAGGVLVLLTVLTLTGAFYPAIDAIAGEKERGTIETLLIAPCRIDDVVFGKFLGVLAITLATLVANVTSIAATAAVSLRYLPHGVVATMPEGTLAVAALATVLAFSGMAALAAATCLAVTTASKSGKEAQNTLTPVILLVSAVAGTALLPGKPGGPLLAAVPFAGQIAVARVALGGDTGPPATILSVMADLAVSLASSAVATWILLRLTAHTLADED